MKKPFKLLCILAMFVLILVPMQLSLASEAGDGESTKGVEERLKDAIALYIGSSQAFVNNVETQVDPTNANVKPYVKNGRTLVPVRFISESLGAEVGWDGSSSTVTVRLNGKVVKLVVGSKTMKVGSKDVELDTAAEISENRTYLPLRSLVEALGKKVFYDRGLIVIGDKEDLFDKTNEKALIDEVISKVNNLPVVGTYDALKKLFENSRTHGGYYRGEVVALESSVNKEMKIDEAVQSPAADSNPSEGASGGASDYSTTNVQVQGVDEADVVKTDGEYIYQVNKDRIVIVRASPASQMSIVGVLDFTNDNFTPEELYIDGKYLVAIGGYYEETRLEEPQTRESKISVMPYLNKSTTKAIICDISDRSNITKLREVEIEGTYVSSRKIGSALYLVANKYSNTYYLKDEVQIQTPSYRDTAAGNDYAQVGYEEIRYFPGSAESNYMTIAALDIESDEKANIQTYLGAGQNVYASNQNLYVAVTNYKNDVITPALEDRAEIAPTVDKPSDGVVSTAVIADPIYEDRRITNLYKFSLNGTKVTYLNKGEVPGTILNQFSMDENNGYFRIATTVGEVWGRGANTSKNNVYILDETLNITGKIEDMAPGERIYSVRFMGDRGYVVTFKQVDPLFVIDLKDPANPKILGALKIPGYSDYLHPYDENHIIGFGKDTVAIKDNAYYTGMKIALFDVTDVSNPIQKFSEIIGDRGTDSELLRNHKALLFSKNKNLLAFPVMVMEVKDKNSNTDFPEYGQFTFQGAYVYNLDIENGFVLKGKITHLTEEDILKAGSYYYNPDKYVERILYIGDTLYTMSKGMFKAHGIGDLKERGSLVIP